MYLDRELSQRIARRVHADPQRCYHNAYAALQNCRELSIGHYVEGYAVSERGAVFEHGWVELGLKIVDPTLYSSALTYFAGLRFDRWKIWEAIDTVPRPAHARDELPIFCRFGLGGCDSPDMVRACARATALGASRKAG